VIQPPLQAQVPAQQTTETSFLAQTKSSVAGVVRDPQSQQNTSTFTEESRSHWVHTLPRTKVAARDDGKDLE
jgi:hypothetical protein